MGRDPVGPRPVVLVSESRRCPDGGAQLLEDARLSGVQVLGGRVLLARLKEAHGLARGGEHPLLLVRALGSAKLSGVHSDSFPKGRGCGPGPGVRRTPAGPFLFTPAFYYFFIT
jgi:hypothetical protein